MEHVFAQWESRLLCVSWNCRTTALRYEPDPTPASLPPTAMSKVLTDIRIV